MKQIRIAGTVVLILFVFLGNIGVNVFVHSCPEDGTFTSIIVKSDDHCKDHVEELDACCSEVEIKDDCCKDEVKIYHVKFDYFDSYDLDVQPFTAIIYEKPAFYISKQCVTNCNHRDYKLRPPPKKPNGQKLLILNQVFRI